MFGMQLASTKVVDRYFDLWKIRRRLMQRSTKSAPPIPPFSQRGSKFFALFLAPKCFAGTSSAYGWGKTASASWDSPRLTDRVLVADPANAPIPRSPKNLYALVINVTDSLVRMG